MNKNLFSEFPLGSLVTIKQGYTFSRSYQGNAEGKWMYVKVADLNSLGNKKYVYRTKNYVDDDVLEKIKATPFPTNSIVFPRVGAALKLNNKLILNENCVTDDNVIVLTITDKAKCYFEYLYYWLELQDLGRFCNSGAVPVISGKNLKKELVPLPPIDYQKNISRVLSEWDNAIEKTETLIAAKENQFKWLAHTIIREKCHHWKHYLAKKLFASVSSKGHPDEELLSVTQDRGVIPRTMLKGRVMSPAGSTAGYKLVEKGNFVISLRSFQGGLEYSAYRGIVSPAYTILSPKKEIHADFYRHFFKSYIFVEKYLSVAVIGIRDGKQISSTDFDTVKIPYPDMDEQIEIASNLDSARLEIDLLKNVLEKYRLQKRGLMQKLLAGEWQVSVQHQATEETVKEVSA